jgi:superfamily I DNA and/or RNA helicase
MRLIACLTRLPGRILLCAPTNVGAANLYERCVHHGYASESSLSIAPDRVPPGTAVQSNDPGRRIVCATISSRSGPILDAQSFDSVLVDEAAQCMEAWIWTLLRSDVTFLALAGDVHQLPAMVSESGRALRHDRSLLERLMSQNYDNVTSLTVQNRMCPEILALTNDRFYEGRLTCGPHAPTSGVVQIIDLEGREEADGTSYYNMMEVEAIQKICTEEDLEKTIVICPYTAQCRRILACGIGVAVHTIDSFQGREADTVIVSFVRDGSSGIGFWSDYRRLVVALTRARRRLVLVVSNRETSWSRVFANANRSNETRQHD